MESIFSLKKKGMSKHLVGDSCGCFFIYLSKYLSIGRGCFFFS